MNVISRIKAIVFFSIVAGVFVCSTQVEAQETTDFAISTNECDLFVATNGNDSANGSAQAPFRTIQHGITQLTNTNKVLCIRGGSYAQTVKVLNKHGTASAPIKIGAYSGGGPVIIDAGSYTLPDPLCRQKDVAASTAGDCGLPAGRVCRDSCMHDALFSVKDSSFIELYAVEIKGSSGRGLEFVNTENTLVSGVNSHTNWNKGMIFDQCLNTRIEDSSSSDNLRARAEEKLIGGAGVEIHGCTNTSVERVKVFRNFGEGLSIGKESSRTLVQNSMMWESSHGTTYANDHDNTVFNANYFFCTGDRMNWLKSYDLPSGENELGKGLILRDEPHNDFATGTNNIIINNMFAGCTTHLVLQGGPGKDIYPVLIANNTFVEARAASGTNAKKPAVLDFTGSGNYIGASSFFNNIIMQQSDNVNYYEGDLSHINFRNNISNKSTGLPGFTVADPKLARLFSPSLVNDPSSVDPRHWLITQGSPAINAGLAPPYSGFTPGERIHQDIFANIRPIGSTRDIGAFEFGGTSDWDWFDEPTIVPSPTSTPSWDLNNDGEIDVFDFGHVIVGFGSTYSLADLQAFLNQFR